jgi:hypothetical protein
MYSSVRGQHLVLVIKRHLIIVVKQQLIQIFDIY